MICPVWTLKSVHDPFGMEYDQTLTIRFLWNDAADAHQIADILQAKFVEHSDHFKKSDSGL
jgi:predicted TIM-barrel enzyme